MQHPLLVSYQQAVEVGHHRWNFIHIGDVSKSVVEAVRRRARCFGACG